MKSQHLRAVMRGAQGLLMALVIGFIFDIPSRFEIGLYTEQFLAAVLGLALFLAFLIFPGFARREGRVPWIDIAAGALGLAACWYVAVDYPTLSMTIVYRPPEGIILGSVIVLLVIEAARRTAGTTMVAAVLLLCLYALLGHMMPGEFATRPVDLSRLAVYLGVDTNAIFGAPIHVAAVVVVPFVLMGQVLSRSGGTDYFTDIAMAMMGRYRGGSAKIAVVGSALFGMVSGSAVANVAGVGVVTIPLMKRSGFPAPIAASIEAVGSTGGQLMPPVMGAAAFLMAEYLQVPYASVMIAAALPAALYYIALFVQVDLEAAKRGIAGAPIADLPHALPILLAGWHFPIAFAVMVLALVSWNWPAEYAAVVTAAVLVVFGMVFGYRGKRLTAGQVVESVIATGGVVVDMIIITAAAGLVIGVLNLTGLAFGLTMQLLAVSGNNLAVLLLVTAVVATILGMGMPTVGVYVILASLAAPALIKAGISPMQAHMFVMYFGMMSMVTPPVALAAFAAANIAQTDPWKTGWIAVRIGWCAYIVPFLFATSPSLLLEGSLDSVVLSSVTAALGVYMGSVAAVGYCRTAVGPATRVAFAITGVCLLVPVDMFPGALLLNLAALLAAALLIARELLRGRALRASVS